MWYFSNWGNSMDNIKKIITIISLILLPTLSLDVIRVGEILNIDTNAVHKWDIWDSILNVTGEIISATNITAQYFIGSGLYLTDLPKVSNATYSDGSDKVDGYHASSFYLTTDKVANATYADDSDKLDGLHAASFYLTTDKVANATYSDDADKLDGYHASSFYRTTDKVANATYADDSDMLDGHHWSEVSSVKVSNATYSDDSNTLDTHHWSEVITTRVNNATFADNANNSAYLGGTIASAYLTSNGMASEASYLYVNGSRAVTGGDLSLKWGNLTSYPSACSSGQAITTLGDTITCASFMNSDTQYLYINGSRAVTGGDLSLAWTNLTSYPAACTSGQFVSGLGDTITCGTPSGGSGGGNYLLNESYGVAQSINSTLYAKIDSAYDLGLITYLSDTQTPTLDTYTAQNDPDAVKGLNNEVYSGNSTIGMYDSRQTFAYFDLMSFVQTGGVYTDVTLYLYKYFPSYGSSVPYKAWYDCNETFTESTSTWNNYSPSCLSYSSGTISGGNAWKAINLTNAFNLGTLNKGLIRLLVDTELSGYYVYDFYSSERLSLSPYLTRNFTSLGRFNNTYSNYFTGSYKSSDGSLGITNTTGFWMCKDSSCTTKCQVSIKGGLITGCA